MVVGRERVWVRGCGGSGDGCVLVGGAGCEEILVVLGAFWWSGGKSMVDVGL